MYIAKQGEKVVFSSKVVPKPPIIPPSELIEGETYIVASVDYNDFTYKIKCLDSKTPMLSSFTNWYDHVWFKSLAQLRKEKLQQIEGRR